jgi:hypothetical protein
MLSAVNISARKLLQTSRISPRTVACLCLRRAAQMIQVAVIWDTESYDTGWLIEDNFTSSLLNLV